MPDESGTPTHILNRMGRTSMGMNTVRVHSDVGDRVVGLFRQTNQWECWNPVGDAMGSEYRAVGLPGLRFRSPA